MSITGQASGSNIVTFTTGRGLVTVVPAPSLKLAITCVMFNHMEDMDINCGEVLDEDLSIEEMGERILRK